MAAASLHSGLPASPSRMTTPGPASHLLVTPRRMAWTLSALCLLACCDAPPSERSGPSVAPAGKSPLPPASAVARAVPTPLPEGLLLPVLRATGPLGVLSRADIACVVRCSVDVSADGHVTSVRGIPGRCPIPFPTFESWVRTFRFRPATVHGAPAPSSVVLRLSFSQSPYSISVTQE